MLFYYIYVPLDWNEDEDFPLPACEDTCPGDYCWCTGKVNGTEIDDFCNKDVIESVGGCSGNWTSAFKDCCKKTCQFEIGCIPSW